ncbi:MAG: M14 family zinc carboxypeptidase [Bacteroidota bacterium]
MSLNKPHFKKYKGLGPESEPESRALANLVRKEKPAAVSNYHSSGEVIYWLYGLYSVFNTLD